MSPFIKVERYDHILELVLNRPNKMNALTLDMYQELADGIRLANQDDEIRVLLIRGEGDSFCAGNDINDFLSEITAEKFAPITDFLFALADNDKPLIATVQGSVVGIGVTMLLHADLVYASDDARFSLPFVQIGACIEGGASRLLPALCGYQKAAKIALLGDFFDAHQAEDLGLVTQIGALHQAQEYAREACVKIANLSVDSVHTTRRLMKQHDKPMLRKVIHQEIVEFQRLLRTDDAKQRLAALVAR